MKPFSIAALQLDLNYSENYELVAEKSYEVCKRYPWVQMIVLSELAVGGSSRSLEFSLEKQLPKFQKIAQELNIWYIPGSFYDHVNDEVKNVAPVISPEGNLVTTCAKTYPFLPYEKGTICLPDEFAHNYSGKVYLWDKDLNQPLASAFKTPDEFLSAVRSGKYEFHNSGEIATMGIEGLVHGAYNMTMDDGYRHFILGLLGGF